MKLLVFKNIEELSVDFCNNITQLTSGKEKFFLALSGGTTPKVIFQTLVRDFKKKIEWNKVHFFWGDERCVPPDHSESNYGMAKEYLLDHIDIPVENIYRIKGEDNPDNEAERYSNEIKKYLPEVNGLPQFDAAMLGLGEDGHTASIFPDQLKLLSSDKICETAIHPSTKQKRITLTGKVINNSGEIYFLVTGKKKSIIVKKILNKKNNYLKFPASHINPFNGELFWFLGDEAASELYNP
jgi:6-phosphogluconolactonase